MTEAQELHPCSAEEYQRMFCEKVGLRLVDRDGFSTTWSSPGVGTIRSFGSLDAVHTGIGDYVVPVDFITCYDYEFAYLHFGKVTSGLTYAVDETERVGSMPSTFANVERSPVSPIKWTRGLRFKGTEMSIHVGYLNRVILPALGLKPSDLSYLRPNLRFTHLPDELAGVMDRAESLLTSSTYSAAMQAALAMEFVACLARPDIVRALTCGEHMATERLRVGGRIVTVTAGEFKKIAAVHAHLIEHAREFPSIKALARWAGLSEQMLKVGFSHMYQMTIWEFANTVRMGLATELLRESDDSVARIAEECGYQSQAAFISMYKRWSGMTPRRFRTRLRQ